MRREKTPNGPAVERGGVAPIGRVVANRPDKLRPVFLRQQFEFMQSTGKANFWHGTQKETGR
ncbi:MAG: hypothetical protein AMXMBFR59_41280 [Rhodanobacteraceae bacterium]